MQRKKSISDQESDQTLTSPQFAAELEEYKVKTAVFESSIKEMEDQYLAIKQTHLNSLILENINSQDEDELKETLAKAELNFSAAYKAYDQRNYLCLILESDLQIKSINSLLDITKAALSKLEISYKEIELKNNVLTRLKHGHEQELADKTQEFQNDIRTLVWYIFF
jgi:predicted DNA-binding protein